MIYLYDFLFALILLIIWNAKFLIRRKHAHIYLQIRYWVKWCEFAYILLGIYFMPDHNLTEALVAFFLSICTKLLVDYLRKFI